VQHVRQQQLGDGRADPLERVRRLREQLGREAAAGAVARAHRAEIVRRVRHAPRAGRRPAAQRYEGGARLVDQQRHLRPNTRAVTP